MNPLYPALDNIQFFGGSALALLLLVMVGVAMWSLAYPPPKTKNEEIFDAVLRDTQQGKIKWTGYNYAVGHYELRIAIRGRGQFAHMTLRCCGKEHTQILADGDWDKLKDAVHASTCVPPETMLGYMNDATAVH